MDRDREDKLVVLSVEVVEMIAPDVLYVARVDEAMAVGCLLDEHHRWQIIDIPVRRDLDQSGLWAML